MKKWIIVVLATIVVILGAIILFSQTGTNRDVSEYLDIKKSDYMGVKYEVEKLSEDVDDEEIEERIDTERESAAKIIDKKGEAEKGDIAVISYTVWLPGEDSEKYSADKVKVIIGKDALAPDFEDELIGMEPGDINTFKVRYPKDYPEDEKLEGQKVKVRAELISLSERKVPSLKEYVKEYTSYDSINEYERATEKALLDERKAAYVSGVKSGVWAEVLKNVKVKFYPENELKAAKESQINGIKYMAETRKMSVKEARKLLGLEENAKYEKFIKTQAKRALKGDLIVEYIVQHEKIKVSSEKIDKLASEFASRFDKKEMEARYGKTFEEFAKDTLIKQAVVNLVRKNAKIKYE